MAKPGEESKPSKTPPQSPSSSAPPAPSATPTVAPTSPAAAVPEGASSVTEPPLSLPNPAEHQGQREMDQDEPAMKASLEDKEIIEGLEADLREVKSKLEKFESVARDGTQENNTLKALLKASETTYTAQIAGLEEQLKEGAKDAGKFREQMRENEDENKRLKLRTQNTAREIHQLKERLKVAEKVEPRLDAAARDIEDLERQLARDAARYEDSLARRDGQITQATTLLEDLRESERLASTEARDLRAELSTLQVAFTSTSEQLDLERSIAIQDGVDTEARIQELNESIIAVAAQRDNFKAALPRLAEEQAKSMAAEVDLAEQHPLESDPMFLLGYHVDNPKTQELLAEARRGAEAAAAENRALYSKIADFNNQIEGLPTGTATTPGDEAAEAKAKAKIAELTAEIESIRLAQTGAMAEAQRLRAKLVNTEDALKRSLDNAAGSQGGDAAQIRELKDKIMILEAQGRSAEEEFERVRANLKRDKKHLREKNDQLVKVSGEQVSKMEWRIVELESGRGQNAASPPASAPRAELDQVLQSADDTLSALQNQLEECRKSLADQATAAAQHAATLKLANMLQQQVERFKKDLTKTKSRLPVPSGEEKGRNEHIDQLRTELAGARRVLEAEKRSHSDLETAHAKCVATEAANDALLADVRRQLSDKEDSLNVVNNQYDQYVEDHRAATEEDRKEIEKLAGELHMLKEKLEDCEKHKTAPTAGTDEPAKHLDDKKKIDNREAKLRECEEHVENKKKIDDLETNLRDCEKRKAAGATSKDGDNSPVELDLQAQVAALQVQLAELEAERAQEQHAAAAKDLARETENDRLQGDLNRARGNGGLGTRGSGGLGRFVPTWNWFGGRAAPPSSPVTDTDAESTTTAGERAKTPPPNNPNAAATDSRSPATPSTNTETASQTKPNGSTSSSSSSRASSPTRRAGSRHASEFPAPPQHDPKDHPPPPSPTGPARSSARCHQCAGGFGTGDVGPLQVAAFLWTVFSGPWQLQYHWAVLVWLFSLFGPAVRYVDGAYGIVARRLGLPASRSGGGGGGPGGGPDDGSDDDGAGGGGWGGAGGPRRRGNRRNRVPWPTQAILALSIFWSTFMLGLALLAVLMERRMWLEASGAHQRAYMVDLINGGRSPYSVWFPFPVDFRFALHFFERAAHRILFSGGNNERRLSVYPAGG